MAKPTQVKILSELGTFLKGLLSLGQKILLFDTEYLYKSRLKSGAEEKENMRIEVRKEG